jgi:cell surface hyaluronidase
MHLLHRPARRVLHHCLAIPLCLIALPLLAADKVALPPAVTSLPQGGFELPNLAATGWTQTVSGSSWTFANGGGIAANGSIWGAPSAADGDQVAIVQNGGTITQTFTPAAPGRYRITLKAARRAGSNHTFLITVNGTQVASVNAPGTAWTAFASSSFALTTAAATVQITGIGTATDNTSFVDDLRLEPVSWADDAGFENAVLNSSGYNPAGSGWTFSGASGVFSAPGIWTNVAAPEGSKFALLQGNPGTRISQTVTTQAGRYMLRLYGAQRYAAPLLQTVSIRVDNVEVARITPAGTSYESFRTDGIALSAGPHLLEFVALNETPDKTAFLDQIQLVPVASAARRWSDPATWGGSIPAAGDDVSIPSGSVVLLDVNPVSVPTFKSVDVDSDAELHCDDTDIKLATEWMLVSGRFICGARGTPYQHDFELTLAGIDDSENVLDMNMGDKFLAAMSPGVIELHGRARTSWAQLNGSVTAGANSLQLASQVNWQVGDKIVIAPTRWSVDPVTGGHINEAEVREINGINEAGTVIQVKPALAYPHYGAQSTYSNSVSSWTLDERAEIGLLSRNITIQGDAGSSGSQFGGHMMSMAGTSVHVSGVEFYRMGQLAKLARYPFHWHLVGNAPGQYIDNSSVHESYNRCITVHGTHQTRVAGNVCYNFVGHGYFLEDGIETKNVFDGNLGIWGRKPPVPDPPPLEGQLPLETDYRAALASSGPATFWISNPDNTVINNVAAGGLGSAFWYHTMPTVTGASVLAFPALAAATNPATAPMGLFDNNRAHSSIQGFSSCRFGGDSYGLDTPGAQFKRLTTNNVVQGIWPCGLGNSVFENAIVANTANGMQAPQPFTFKDSVFIAYSANKSPQAARALDLPWSAVWMYDQGFIFDNIHFVNYDQPAMSVFQTVGGAHKLPNNRMSRASFANSPNRFRDIFGSWRPGTSPVAWGESIHDLDGSFVGLAPDGTPRAMVSSHPLMTDASCSRAPGSGIDGYACPYRYATFRMDEYMPASEPIIGVAPKVTVLRSDGVHDSSSHDPFQFRFQQAFMVNGPFRYSYRYDAGFAHNSLNLQMWWNHPGDTSVHELLDVPDTIRVSDSGWQQVFNLPDLLNATQPAWYSSLGSSSLYVKMRGNLVAPDWGSMTTVNLCLSAGTSCATEQRMVSAPVVHITSPGDGARINADTKPTFTATASHASGIASVRLYIGDSFEGEDLVAPYSITTTNPLAAGSYPVKLVVKANNLQTFTAVQQLLVGDTAPRIELSSPASDESTYFAGSIPNLAYSTANWSGSGRHVHWFDNGVDMGDAVSGAIPLWTLSQGRHKLEVALANADHSVLPVRSTRHVTVVHDGYIADFEDGLDPRGELLQHLPSGDTPGVLHYDWTPVRVGREAPDNDDINHFENPPLTDPPGTTIATYVLNLTPGMTWSPYSHIDLRHWGPGFEVLLAYKNVKHPVSVGFVAAASIPVTSTLQLPAIGNNTVQAVLLRHRTDAAGLRQHLYSLRVYAQ